jgi:dipeptidyl aminopeptidase/acylaminoacyl peptidase
MYRIIISIICITMFFEWADGQINIEYQKPHEDILKLVDVDPAPQFILNDEASVAVLLYRHSFLSIEELSEQEMRLAGLRINPKMYAPSRQRYSYKMEILDIQSGKTHPVKDLAQDAKITGLSWSPKQDKIAFTQYGDDGVELWILDVHKKTCRPVEGVILNAAFGTAYSWLADNDNLLVKTKSKNAKNIIRNEDLIPSGPVVSTNDGQKAQNRTYQDLLKNKTDEHNLEALTSSEIWMVNSTTSEKKMWLSEGMHGSISFSPDNKYVMVRTVKKPFSYLVPVSRFPAETTIYDIDGNKIKVLVDDPLLEELPKGFMAVQGAPRSHQWREDKPATVVWVEALDGGDPATEAEYRDAIYMWDIASGGDPVLLTRTQLRYAGLDWASDDLAISYERWYDTRTSRINFIKPGNPNAEPVLFSERNYQDSYNDPGRFATKKNEFGRYVLHMHEGNLILEGNGYSDEGKHPFVDLYSLSDFTTKRWYQVAKGSQSENILRLHDLDNGELLVRIESNTEFPNYFIRNIKTGELRQISHFENPFETLNGVQKEVIQYQRYDGVELSGTLYLPPGYDTNTGGRLPMLLWAYPREFKDAATAGQITADPNSFIYPFYGSPIYWVMRGYAVLDNAAFPIIGVGDEEPNDSFVPQLVGNAKAAIDALDAMGIIDPKRVGVGGHSYGAFMTANLLSHSDLFAAGIARSGAYNRTLTPFGFQSEQRNYWEAPEIYNTMSPFMNAEKMKTPLLLIHGIDDNNAGTYPMQSERYFNALKGLGATTRLVMLPKESHGYAARESILHMLWEQDEWLEKYVKNRDVQP